MPSYRGWRRRILISEHIFQTFLFGTAFAMPVGNLFLPHIEIGFLALWFEEQNWIEFLALHLLYPVENTVSVITSFLHTVYIILLLDIV